MTVYLFNKPANNIFRNKKVSILTSELDRETRYNDLAIQIIREDLKRKRITLVDSDADYKYKSQIKSLEDNENTILKWNEVDINSLLNIIKKIDDREVIVLTTNNSLDIENKEILFEDIELKDDILYLVYDVKELIKYINAFENINVVIPIYNYNSFYFAKVNYVYTNNISDIIYNDINNIDEKVKCKIYPIQKDPYSFVKPLREYLLY